MYRIINITTGEDVGFADEIRYIRDNDGVYVEAAAETATGISYRSIPYSLADTDGIDGLDTVFLLTVQNSEYATETKRLTDELLLSMLKA